METIIAIVTLMIIYLGIKKILTTAVSSYLDSFFDDPTGGIVPLDSPEKK